jgi:hypothetical protein
MWTMTVCLCGLPDRSPTAEASLQDTVLPSIPVFLLDNALHSLHHKIAAACRKRRLLIPSYGTVLRRVRAYDARISRRNLEPHVLSLPFNARVVRLERP